MKCFTHLSPVIHLNYYDFIDSTAFVCILPTETVRDCTSGFGQPKLVLSKLPVQVSLFSRWMRPVAAVM